MKRLCALITAVCFLTTSCAEQRYQHAVKEQTEYYKEIESGLAELNPILDEKCGIFEDVKPNAAIEIIDCRNAEITIFLTDKDFAYPELLTKYTDKKAALAKSYSQKKIPKRKFSKSLTAAYNEFLVDLTKAINTDLASDLERYQRQDKVIKGVATAALVVTVIAVAAKGGGGGNNYSTPDNYRGCCSYHQGVNMCYAGRILCNDGQYSPTCRC